MAVGVELLAERVVLLDALRLERLDEEVSRHGDTLVQRAQQLVLVLLQLGGRDRGDGALKVVVDRQQRASERLDAVVRGVLDVASRDLARVLHLGQRTEELLFELIALGRQLLELLLECVGRCVGRGSRLSGGGGLGSGGGIRGSSSSGFGGG